MAGIGLYFISGNGGLPGVPTTPIGAFLLTILAAVFWGISNIIARYASKQAASQGKTINMLGLVVWSSLIPPLSMLAKLEYQSKSVVLKLRKTESNCARAVF